MKSMRDHANRISLLVGALLCLLAGGLTCQDSILNAADAPATPVSMVVLDGNKVLTANRDRGSVSLIDSAAGIVLSETFFCKTPVRLRGLGRDRCVLLDHTGHELFILKTSDGRVEATQRLATPRFPIDCVASDDHQWLVVSGLWSRRLDIIPLQGDAMSLELPFCPRCVLLMEDRQRIVVSDAFGDRLAVIRYETTGNASLPSALHLDSVRDLIGHNIRDWVRLTDERGDRLLFSHMMLSPLAHPSLDEIHWGNYLSSGIGILPMVSLLDRDATLSSSTQRITLGDVGAGAADPESFFVDELGRIATAVGGTGQVIIHDSYGNLIGRVAVGRGPVDIAPLDDSRVAVLNRFSDSLTVLAAKTDSPQSMWEVINTIPLSSSPEWSDVLHGEQLFHDASLSHDGWMSCQSCHTDGHSNGLLADTLGDQSKGAAKRVLSLRGVDGTEPLAWNGTMAFESQIKKSVKSTMHGRDLTGGEMKALAAYLKSLPRTPKYRSEGGGDAHRQAVARGRKLFQSQKCGQCHAGGKKTSAETYDVGVTDELGTRRFNPPSLRGVVYRDGLLHDARASNFNMLFREHNHPVGDNQAATPNRTNNELSDKELLDLTEFLKSL